MGVVASRTLVPFSILIVVLLLAIAFPRLAEGSRSKADLTREEFAKLLTGRVPPELERQFHEALGALSPPEPMSFPTRFDWRDSLALSPVRDQECGDCWAQAAVAAVESQMRIYDGDTTLLSVQQAIDCNYFNASCSGGWPHSVYTLYKMVGAVTEDAYPYVGLDNPCAQDTCDFILNTEGWHFIDTTEVSIKSQLMSHGPLVAWMEAWTDMGDYTGGCFERYGPTPYGHLVLIAGWDDAMCDGAGAWLIKNSWGTGWGEDGYGWIKFDVGRIGYLAMLVNYTPRQEASVLYESFTLDDSAGDADGRPDPGETLTMSVTLRNIRWGVATNVSATIMTTTPGVEVLTGSATFPDIGSGAAEQSHAPHFVFSVDGTVDCGDRIHFILSMTSDQGPSTARFDMATGYYETVFLDAAEVDTGWTNAPDDDAVYGIWGIGDPRGSLLGDSMFVQPELDHTPGGGFKAYLTQNAKRHKPPDQRDVDGGKTTYISPVLDVSDYASARLRYWLWYTNDTDSISPPDDTLLVDISADAGSTWVNLETVSSSNRSWDEREFEIRDFIPLTGGLRLRFTASDYGADNTVEAAIDDVEVIACPDEDPAGVEENVNVDTPEQVELLGSRHNPFANSTHVFFELPRRMHVSIRVYDSAGRLTADILSRIKSAGVHSVPWDGRTASGTRAAPGMYFIRLEAGGAARTAKAVLVR
jgi:hypothetical protein